MVNLDDPIIPNGHFTWREFLYLHAWDKYATPTDTQVKNAKLLFGYLEPLRKELNKPLEITSGLRTPEYVTYLREHGTPAALNGPHNQGQAVDLSCPSMRTIDLWHFFNERWEGRMENLAFTPTWNHLDTWYWGEKQRFNP